MFRLTRKVRIFDTYMFSERIEDSSKPTTGVLGLKIKGNPQSLRWWITFLLKSALIIFSIEYLYRNIITSTRFHDIFILSASTLYSSPRNALILSISILLILANWGIEAAKWQMLVYRFHKISLWQSFKAILAGTSVSMWFPNRSGEYFGRVVILKPKARVKGILATLIGSVSQLTVTLIMGILGLIVYEYGQVDPYIWFSILMGGSIIIALLFFFYFNIRHVRKLLPQANWVKPVRRYLLIYSLYSNQELRKILYYSTLRYLVFCTQFYLLLLFYGINVPTGNAFTAIFLTYLLQTLSPANAITELAIRGKSADMLFKVYTANILGVVAASYTLWFINLILPAIVGLFILLRARVNNRTKQ